MKRRCVFLDRDGVINVKPADGEYIRSWEEFKFIPEVVDWIRLFNVLGFMVIVVTNQRGVGRALIQPEVLHEIHSKMVAELARAGARVDDVLFCPHEEDTCDCRKPKPGLIVQAQKKWDIDTEGSVLIGDSERDRLLADRCGMRFILVRNGRIISVDTAEELRL